MQRTLQKKYEGQWEKLTPQQARSQLLWSIAELGEVIDVIKKRGEAAVEREPEARHHFIEEMGDVMMYLMDVLLCFRVSGEEFSRVYREKHLHNLRRQDWKAQLAQRERAEAGAEGGTGDA